MSPQRLPSRTQKPPQPYLTLSQQRAASSPSRRSNGDSTYLTSDGHSRPKLPISLPKLETSAAALQKIAMQTPLKSSRSSAESTFIGKSPLLLRGQPRSHQCIPNIISSKTLEINDTIQNDVSMNEISMPMPVRPKKYCSPLPKIVARGVTSSAKKDSRPKAYLPEVPPLAPHFSPFGNTDFFPWGGSHPEDQFSEQIIRQGYYDKSQITQNEIGSARSLIFPALKHKSGLQMLSSVFTNILVQRRAYGQITSSSTFKPPPRVTVTDTKREIWLKDLANPTSSLRRLSRSIPHGIRGKVLLEQSLVKNIPIERAVWLAKCVGANELRSFRRKGVSGTSSMGGEAKWIRDFTVCVEQFLENIIGACGGPDFKVKINYAIRLSTHFHAEYLLDREHYMDWLVMSLENTTQARLPIWLLIIQIYWKDLLQFRKYGCRLSSTLLNQLAGTLDNPDSDLLIPLSKRLTLLIKDLILTKHDNLIAPKTWMKFKTLVYSCLGSDNEQVNRIIKSIDRRNSRLVPLDVSKKDNSEKKLIRILDQSLITPYSSLLAKEAWNLSDDKRFLVNKVLNWATSSYRLGKTKLYVAIRLLRSWSQNGISVTENILDFLDSKSCEISRNKSDLYHIISELARSGHFSSSKYFQWLIARGGLQGSDSLCEDGPCVSRLLAELPTANLSQSLKETRLNLLKRANFSTEIEQNCMKRCVLILQRDLTITNDNTYPSLSKNGTLSDEIKDLLLGTSRTIKSDIGSWLRDKFCHPVTQTTISPINYWENQISKSEKFVITSCNFTIVRSILEEIGDFSMLADILKAISKTSDFNILASCADTLSLNLEIFAAIGALKEIFNILLSRSRTFIDELNPSLGNFLSSLFDLSLRLEDQKLAAEELSQEILCNFKKSGIDACSPISDHMTSAEAIEALFCDEIEKYLATGNKLDQTVMERLFQRIMSVLQSSWEEFPEQQRSCGMLLTRLRAFHPQYFDVLMNKWLNQSILLPNRPSLIQFCAPLISYGCLTLRDVLESCESKITVGDSKILEKIPSEALVLLLSSSEISKIMTKEEVYRFHVKQLCNLRNCPENVLSTLRNALKFIPCGNSFFSQPDLQTKLLPGSSELQKLLQHLILFNSDLFFSKLLLPILDSSNTEAINFINNFIDIFLSSSSFTLMATEFLVDIADDLSLPFCQVKLRVMFRLKKASSDSYEYRLNQIEQLYSTMESAIASGKKNWANLIVLLDLETAQQLRIKAESNFLALIPSPRSLINDFAVLQQRVSRCRNLLLVIQATSYCELSISSHNNNYNRNNTNLPSEIATALNGLWILLTNHQSEEVINLVIESWIPLLFSFISAHANLFESSKYWPEIQVKILIALTSIYFRLQSLDKNIENIEDLIEHSYDLALQYVDFISDDVRNQCIRNLNDAASNSYISYLYSHFVNPSEHLVLSQTDGKTNTLPGIVTDDATSLVKDKMVPFSMRRWEMLSEPTPNVGENDTSLSLTLFGARRG
ncbi:Mediator of RNA polymerase II transcription subunit 12 [Erysiphe neolycopersici]|uniref:Mediator of RNA polymerase II transcription subunit 12 n=1 Tax=Erysiphe neolycopersici TaxID=212602 RepID=A0A420I3W8_9PEZI|nr:Mediator of RNA polymerase II transcription subunit 12 [Erysiphe neolycopersici]